MTGRRKIVFALSASLIALPLRTGAQQTASIPTVGILSLEQGDRTAALREGLRKLGYVEGRNIRLETRKVGDRFSGLAEVAHEFVQRKVDVIVAFGATAAHIARKATSTIPIVMVVGVDPVQEKMVQSLSRPGGNVTGVSLLVQELTSKRMESVKEAIPGLKRLGLVWDPNSRGNAAVVAQAHEAAKALGLQLEPVEVRLPADFDKAFEIFARRGIKIFFSASSSMVIANHAYFLAAASKYKLAGIFSSHEWVGPAVLLSYGQSFGEADRHAATYVDKILKGARPGDLPIEQPTKYELVVNLSTAKTLGITIPPSVMVRATKVIE